jgi:hypothetical protein
MEFRIVDLWFTITGGLIGRYHKFTGKPDPSNLNNRLQHLLGSMTLTDICLALPQLEFVISKRRKGTWKATIHLQNIKTSSF